MSLAAINSQYNGLNGIAGGYCGGWGYAGGLYSDANVGNIKQSIANGYEISAASNSYANKASVSSSNFTQQSQAIQYLLQEGREDDAIAKYHSLFNEMASNPYYEGYSENDIKTLMQQRYMEATGSTLVNDINENAGSSFTTGLVSSIPLVGAFLDGTSKSDFIAEVTGTPKSTKGKAGKAAGVVTGMGIGAGLGALSAGLLKKGGKGAKIAGLVIGAAAALATFVTGKIVNAAKD